MFFGWVIVYDDVNVCCCGDGMRGVGFCDYGCVVVVDLYGMNL